MGFAEKKSVNLRILEIKRIGRLGSRTTINKYILKRIVNV